MIGTVRRIILWLGGHGIVVLSAVLVVVLGTWGFVELADEVNEGETQRFDEWAIRSLRRADDPATPIGPPWLHEAGRDLTALGGVMVLSLVTLAVIGYLAMVQKYHAMWFVAIATASGLLLSTAMKRAFERDRPDIVPHLSKVYTSSFPSGHSLLSAVVYLTLGALLARLVPQYAVKIYFIAVALLLTFLVGVSRVYMGVHYPTDVMAGWTAGLVWAILCWLVARYLQVRGTVEKDDEQTEDLSASEAKT
jgi:undecaprenyl-diphosphatase